MTIQISRSKTKDIKSNSVPVIGTAGRLIMQSESMNTIFDQIGGGRKNLFANGKLQVAQRAFASTNPPSGYGATYYYDMWKFQHANHTYSLAFDNSLNCNFLQMQRSDDAVTSALVYAVVEARQNTFVNGEVYTISFLYSGTGLNFEAFFRTGSGGANLAIQVTNRTLPASEGNWAKYEVTFTCNGKISAQTAFNMRFGSYNTDTFRVTQLQLEKGNRATPFEHRPYYEELNICQRYLYVCNVLTGGGVYNSNTSFMSAQQFPVEMRVAPSVSMLNSTSNGGNQYGGINIEHDDNYTISNVYKGHGSHPLSTKCMVITVDRSAQGGAAQGQGGVCVIDADTNQAFVFSAEL
jgi:hypothetical protein